MNELLVVIAFGQLKNWIKNGALNGERKIETKSTRKKKDLEEVIVRMALQTTARGGVVRSAPLVMAVNVDSIVAPVAEAAVAFRKFRGDNLLLKNIGKAAAVAAEANLNKRRGSDVEEEAERRGSGVEAATLGWGGEQARVALDSRTDE